MPFKINEFTSSISATGVSKQDRFEVRITPPSPGGSGESALSRLISALSSVGGTVGQIAGIIDGFGGVDSQHLALRASEAELPGRSTQTIENRYYGPVQKTGYQGNYVDTQITFICSEDLREKLFFEKWQDLIFGDHRTGPNNLTMKNYNAGYYDDYISTIEIFQYNENNDKTYQIKLLEAFPINVNPLSLSWGADDIHKLQVSFAFRSFEDKSNGLSKFAAGAFNLNNALGGGSGREVGGISTSNVRRGIRFLNRIF